MAMHNLKGGHFLIIIVYTIFGDCFGLLHRAYTDVGTIVGKIDDIYYNNTGYKIVSYLGIPYSEEVNEWMRFRKYRLREPFKKPYNATYFRPACLQTGYWSISQTTSENCLFLNIYGPAESTINPRKKFPVIVYIHGGKFKTGTANDISPEVLSVAGDLIVVTINYRLGVFGFLNSGNSFAGGNFGLWDQHLAIRWVRYNIASFGGDVHNITVMGHESGSACAMFQAMYPGNRGLIKRVIAVGGTFLSPWALHGTNLREIATKLKSLDEDELFSFSDEPLVERIRYKSAADILAVGDELENIGPTIDGDFVIAHPFKVLDFVNKSFEDANDFFRSLDIIIGTNENDGNQELVSLISREFGLSPTSLFVSMLSDEIEQILIPQLLDPVFRKQELFMNYTLNEQTRKNVIYSTLYHYTNWTNPDSRLYMRDNLQRLSTDVNFKLPAIQTAEGHSYKNLNYSTYLYQFAHKPSYETRTQEWSTEVDDVAETLFIFGFPAKMMSNKGLAREPISREERQLSNKMMAWISNFARTGDPNKPRKMIGFGNSTIVWPKYDDDRRFLRFTTNMSANVSQGNRFGEPDTSFWTVLVPVLLEGSPPPWMVDRKPGAQVFTAFRIASDKIEVVIISLLTISCGLLVITALLIFCTCRYIFL